MRISLILRENEAWTARNLPNGESLVEMAAFALVFGLYT